MPVTFQVATHPAREIDRSRRFEPNPWKSLHNRAKGPKLLQCSLDAEPKDIRLVPNSNGFVHAVMEAYGSHRHLRIRPDDVWIAILTQLSFYVNAHAEDLRAYFVAHQGQKKLLVDVPSKGFDYVALARAFSREIHKNVTDATLVEWILPDFTTTTAKDMTICSVVMMSTLKAYFKYHCGITCGIPTVTLEGSRPDWETIYRRLDRLHELGDEPAVWASMLRPIIRRFITAFDGKPDVTFWEHVLYRSQYYCGQNDLSGWITAFCVWSPKGEWLPRTLPDVIPTVPKQSGLPPSAAEDEPDLPQGPSTPSLSKVIPKREASRASFGRLLPSPLPTLMKRRTSDKHRERRGEKEREDKANRNDGQPPPALVFTDEDPSGSVMESIEYGKNYTLDGVPFFTLNMDMLPAGSCEVDVTLDDDGNLTHMKMLAGHVAYEVSSTTPDGPLDTVSPAPQWFLFEK